MQIIDDLNNFVDPSDPDLKLPQSIHCYQTAERLREMIIGTEYQDFDWLPLVGLIHDCGKILFRLGYQAHEIVGDTFPVGCPFSDEIIYYDYFVNNPDHQKYESVLGIYSPHVGFENIHFSWGHDEYFASVLEKNIDGQNNQRLFLPKEAIYIIRFHSFYAWHQKQAYTHLASTHDWEMLPLLQFFQRGDLYSKEENKENFVTEEMKMYYNDLLRRYHLDKPLLLI
jgi:inositol oxygenase